MSTNGARVLGIVFKTLLTLGFVEDEAGQVPGLPGVYTSQYRVWRFYQAMYIDTLGALGLRMRSGSMGDGPIPLSHKPEPTSVRGGVLESGVTTPDSVRRTSSYQYPDMGYTWNPSSS